jgi:hypothetical protein
VVGEAFGAVDEVLFSSTAEELRRYYVRGSGTSSVASTAAATMADTLCCKEELP